MRENLLGLFGLAITLALTSGAMMAQAPPTIQEAMAARGMPHSITSLRASLQDSRPDVRSLAASALAARKDKDSIPLIKQALVKESSPEVRHNFSQALISLGDPKGVDAMNAICVDRTTREDLRIIVASELDDQGNNACVSSVVEMLSSSQDPSIRQSAMQVLLRKKISANLFPALQVGLEHTLEDSVAANREVASECLATFKMTSAESSLIKAIIAEKDPSARTHMQANLSKLKGAPLN